MKWVRDTSGLFAKRPHYLTEELDEECERVIKGYLFKKYQKISFPIATDDLTCLLEQRVEDLDLYADFSGEDSGIEGMTEFRRGRKPAVKISTRLMELPTLGNRLRTTLAHEFGHVHFHDRMFQIETKPGSLFSGDPETIAASRANRCHRDSIQPVDKRDWMEWQAGFVCGAILMPITPLISAIKNFRSRNGLALNPFTEGGLAATELIAEISEAFQVSKDAARVRLLQKRVLTCGGTRTLF